ncbi:hypothetical protein [Aliamphritea spongicola]|nr:hypothetical protein [Aliamphritea spongicola]
MSSKSMSSIGTNQLLLQSETSVLEATTARTSATRMVKNQNKSKSRLGRLGSWIKNIGRGALNAGKALPGATAGMLGITGSGTYLKAKLSTAAQTAHKAIHDVTGKVKNSLSSFWSAGKNILPDSFQA